MKKEGPNTGASVRVRLRAVFSEVATFAVPDDGVTFDPLSVTSEPIRDGQEYGGVRLHLVAGIATAVIRLQIDIGFGDAVTPEPAVGEFPSLLDFPAPRLLVYPRETVVAEKLEAVVKLGLVNSRMKDFYDLAAMARLFEFDGALLARALGATFRRRGTPFPASRPVAFTPAFTDDGDKQAQWIGFARKAGVNDAGDLPTVMASVENFAEEPLFAASQGGAWIRRWPAGGPWTRPDPPLSV